MKTVVRALPGITDRGTLLHGIYGRSPESNSSSTHKEARTRRPLTDAGRWKSSSKKIYGRARHLQKQAINVSHNKMRLERRRYLALSELLNGVRQHFKSPLRLVLIHD